MSAPFANYNFGGQGVNLVKDPLQLADSEATQLQNAELVPDQAKGGEGSLSKRGGLQALNGSAMAGAITGIQSLPLQTTFTRSLYASLSTADSDTWLKTSNGTAWTSTSTPSIAIHHSASESAIGVQAAAAQRRMVSIRNFLLYPGHTAFDLVVPGSNTAPPIVLWDGVASIDLVNIPPGSESSDGNYPFTITDMVKANGKVYFAVHSPTNGGAPDLKGRVLEMNLDTGVVKQIASTFGNGPNAVTGGAIACICFYQGKLWAGLNGGNGTANIGKVVSCYPDIDTTWTTDVANLPGWVRSMEVFQGQLYAGLQGNATNDARVSVRSASAGTWATSDTVVTSGIDYYAGLFVYNSELYATVFSDGGTDVLLIRKFDGTSWTTDRDVAASDSAGVAQHVGQLIEFNSDLYEVFWSTTETATDGFVLRKTGGVWSKVATDNFSGKLGVLVERS